jgi:pyroglutamyl-peptidase
VDLEELVAGLAATEISYDAGKFVCEGLYYEVLKYLGNGKRNVCCIFVHVPILTPENLPSIVADFQVIIDRMASIY